MKTEHVYLIQTEGENFTYTYGVYATEGDAQIVFKMLPQDVQETSTIRCHKVQTIDTNKRVPYEEYEHVIVAE